MGGERKYGGEQGPGKARGQANAYGFLGQALSSHASGPPSLKFLAMLCSTGDGIPRPGIKLCTGSRFLTYWKEVLRAPVLSWVVGAKVLATSPSCSRLLAPPNSPRPPAFLLPPAESLPRTDGFCQVCARLTPPFTMGHRGPGIKGCVCP